MQLQLRQPFSLQYLSIKSNPLVVKDLQTRCDSATCKAIIANESKKNGLKDGVRPFSQSRILRLDQVYKIRRSSVFGRRIHSDGADDRIQIVWHDHRPIGEPGSFDTA